MGVWGGTGHSEQRHSEKGRQGHEKGKEDRRGKGKSGRRELGGKG